MRDTGVQLNQQIQSTMLQSLCVSVNQYIGRQEGSKKMEDTT